MRAIEINGVPGRTSPHLPQRPRAQNSYAHLLPFRLDFDDGSLTSAGVPTPCWVVASATSLLPFCGLGLRLPQFLMLSAVASISTQVVFMRACFTPSDWSRDG